MTANHTRDILDDIAKLARDLKDLKGQWSANGLPNAVITYTRTLPGAVGINASINTGIATLIGCGADSHRGLVVFANSTSQSASLLALQNSGLVDQFTVDKAGQVVMQGSLDIALAGQGLKIAEGTNAKQGTAVLVAGSKVVSNTAVTANSRIFLTSQVDGGTPGWLRVSARTAGSSFTITSSSATDISTVAYLINEPG